MCITFKLIYFAEQKRLGFLEFSLKYFSIHY